MQEKKLMKPINDAIPFVEQNQETEAAKMKRVRVFQHLNVQKSEVIQKHRGGKGQQVLPSEKKQSPLAARSSF